MNSEKTMRGYTLLEAVLVIGMSSVLLLAISGLVGSLFQAYQATRQSQTDLENTQVGLSVFTKARRPSTLMTQDALTLDPLPGGGFYTGKVLYGYDKAQQQCSVYKFDDGLSRLRYGFSSEPQGSDCNFVDIENNLQDLTPSTITNGRFYYRPSEPMSTDPSAPEDGGVGRVTARFTVVTNATHTTDLQTTVSLRDYSYVKFSN